MYIAENPCNPYNLNVKNITIYALVSISRFRTSWTIAVAVLSAILSSHGEGGIAEALLDTGAGGTIAVPALTSLTGNGVAAQSQTTFHESEHATLMNVNSAYSDINPFSITSNQRTQEHRPHNFVQTRHQRKLQRKLLFS